MVALTLIIGVVVIPKYLHGLNKKLQL